MYSMASADFSMLKLEPYIEQQNHIWPKEGKHILAQYDDSTVTVYQAFRKEIAEYAVENQRFGGDAYSFSRMSWIKTNFLWMMYRSGWASKPSQEHILAIKISKAGFDSILQNAYTAKFQKEQGVSTDNIEVRLQWDPDHKPNYECETRRAIQLGLKGKILQKFATDWIVSICDITDLVKRMKTDLDNNGVNELMVPAERVYPVQDPAVVSQIELTQMQSQSQIQI